MPDDYLPVTGGIRRMPAKTRRRYEREMRRADEAMREIGLAASLAAYHDAVRIDRIASTTEHGMMRAAQFAALETALAANPVAAGYAHAIGCGGVAGIAGVVRETSRGF
jgi:hypothetical protein